MRSELQERLARTRRGRLFRRLAPYLAYGIGLSLVITLFWPDLGVNLIADNLALWFGLFIVDVALEQSKAEDQKPAHQAMMFDIIQMRRKITHPIVAALRQFGKPEDIQDLQKASKRQGDAAKILARLDITAQAPMRELNFAPNTPPQIWFVILPTLMSPDRIGINSIIDRYSVIADSELIGALHNIETCLFMEYVKTSVGFFAVPEAAEVFWRSLLQSLDKLDQILALELAKDDGIGAALGPGSYIDIAITLIEGDAVSSSESE